MLGNPDHSKNGPDRTLAPRVHASRSSMSPLGDKYGFARWRASGPSPLGEPRWPSSASFATRSIHSSKDAFKKYAEEPLQQPSGRIPSSLRSHKRHRVGAGRAGKKKRCLSGRSDRFSVPVQTLGLGELLYPDAAGGGLAQMQRLSVHAQGHGLVVLALQHVDRRGRAQM